MNAWRCGFIFILAACAVSALSADRDLPAAIEAAVRDVERCLERPPDSFIEAVLIANRLAQPELKREDLEKPIRKMASKVRRSIDPKSPAEEQLDVLKEVIYEREGFFAPEAPAPLMEGKALEFYALPSVLKKKAAYCEGLALVFTLVGREAGLNVSVLRAPAHVYCRTQINGRGVNIECTDGGRETTEDELMKNSGAKPAARFSGVYFCELTSRGILALQLNSVTYNLITHRSHHKILSADQWKRIASVLLRLQPNDPETLNTAATIYLMTDDRFTAEMLHRRTLDQVKFFGAPEVLKAGLEKR